MPQMNKGGKFIFGESILRADGSVHLPEQAAREYAIASEGRVYLFTGSRSTGGFCVTRRGLLLPSKLGHILTETPPLLRYELPEGAFVRYKGRALLDGDFALRRDSAYGGGAGASAAAGRHAASVHSQQRYCLYDGRKGPLTDRAAHFGGEMPLY